MGKLVTVATGATQYDNLVYTYLLKPMKDLLLETYRPSPVYISPVMMNMSSDVHIRLWSPSSTLISIYSDSGFTRRYEMDIVMYHVNRNPNENFWEYVLRETERTNQILVNNHAYDSSDGSSSVTSWYEGEVEEILINDVPDEDVEGLISVNIQFSCNINRT